MFKVLGDLKSLVDESREQDKECEHLADWCGLVIGILASLANDHKEENDDVDENVRQAASKARKALLGILKLVRTRKDNGMVARVVKARDFKKQSSQAQAALRDLMQALQMGISVKMSNKVEPLQRASFPIPGFSYGISAFYCATQSVILDTWSCFRHI